MKVSGNHRLFWFAIAVILNNLVIGISGIYLPNIPNANILLITAGVFCIFALCLSFIPGKTNRKEKEKDVGSTSLRASKRTPLAGDFDQNNRYNTRLREIELTSSAFFSSYLSMLVVDSDFKIIRINAAFSSLTGYSENQALDNDFSMINHTENADDFQSTIKAYFKYNHQRLWEGEITCRRKQGAAFPAKLVISRFNSEANSATYYAVNLLDLREQRATEDRIIRLAHYDDLTGLCNRVMFCDHLAKLLSRAKHHQGYTVILYLGLDRLQTVNDSLGHQVGDELIKQAAIRLADSMRREDFVARIGGDEFAIMLLPENSHEKSTYSASIIAQKIVSELSKVFFIHSAVVS